MIACSFRKREERLSEQALLTKVRHTISLTTAGMARRLDYLMTRLIIFPGTKISLRRVPSLK